MQQFNSSKWLICYSKTKNRTFMYNRSTIFTSTPTWLSNRCKSAKIRPVWHMPYGGLYLKPGKSLQAAFLYDSILREWYIFILTRLQSFIVYKYCYYLIEIIFRISRFFKMFFAFKVDNSVKFCNKIQQIWSIIQILLSHLVENLCTTLNGEKEIHALCLVFIVLRVLEYFFFQVSVMVS